MKTILNQQDFLKQASFKDNIFNFCANYYRLYLKDIEDHEKSLYNFICLLEWNGESDESYDISDVFSIEEYKDSINNISDFVKKIVDNLLIDNLDEKEFYQKLLEKISDDILFKTEIDKICAIVVLILNPKIPYFKLGTALQMDNNKYKEISTTINKDISKAFFVLQYGYKQKTELASQLYYIVNEQSTEEEKIVLIANILGYYNSQIKTLYNRLNSDEKMGEDSEE